MWQKIKESKSAILGFQVFWVTVIFAVLLVREAGEAGMAVDVLKWGIGASGLLIGNKTVVNMLPQILKKDGKND